MTTKLAGIFGKPRVLLPVIHYAGLDAALASVDVAREHGADGVMLINQGIEAEDLPAFAAAVIARHPGLWVGVNVLGDEPADAFARFERARVPVRGVWSDNGGVSLGRRLRLLTVHGPVWTEGFAERMNELRRRVPDLLYFGGVAFKGQAFVRDEDLAPLASEAQRHMDVVTTSGPRTGAAADPARVAALAGPVEPPTAVGLASGVTSKNVHLYPAAAAFLVATGIEQSNGVLDPAKVRATADTIERGAALRTTS